MATFLKKIIPPLKPSSCVKTGVFLDGNTLVSIKLNLLLQKRLLYVIFIVF
jgi:hypothetical protein